MKYPVISSFSAVCAIVASTHVAHADPLPPDSQAKLIAKLREIQEWASDLTIINEVKSQNAHLPAAYAKLTQNEWNGIADFDPFLWNFTRNAAAEVLREKRNESMAEAFISDSEGFKVAFLSKPHTWAHKGKTKHDVAMSGRSWQSSPETDPVTGLTQLQVSVPIFDHGTPIGSLVVGVNVCKLA